MFVFILGNIGGGCHFCFVLLFWFWVDRKRRKLCTMVCLDYLFPGNLEIFLV